MIRTNKEGVSTKLIGIHLEVSLLKELDSIKKKVPAYSVSGFRNEIVKLGLQEFKKIYPFTTVKDKTTKPTKGTVKK